MKNARIVVLFYNTDHSGMFEEVHYADRKLSEKDFKKWYNHIDKVVTDMWRRGITEDIVDIFAYYEDAVDETCEIACWWGIQEMKHNPHIPF